jgi:dTMP kinase
MRALSRGYLIACEGIDGSGKSSLSAALAERLRTNGYDVVLTKEPGGTSLGTELRTTLQDQRGRVSDRAEYLLFAADRAQHFADIIIPALEARKIIVSDRLADSSLAYQGYGRELDRTLITAVNTWAMQHHRPDYTLYLQIDIHTAQQRLQQRNQQRTTFEAADMAFWQRVLRGFEELYKGRPDVLTLDATHPLEILVNQAAQRLAEITV